MLVGIVASLSIAHLLRRDADRRGIVGTALFILGVLGMYGSPESLPEDAVDSYLLFCGLGLILLGSGIHRAKLLQNWEYGLVLGALALCALLDANIDDEDALDAVAGVAFVALAAVVMCRLGRRILQDPSFWYRATTSLVPDPNSKSQESQRGP